MRTSDLAQVISDLVAGSDGTASRMMTARGGGFSAEVHALVERVASLRERATKRSSTISSMEALLGLAHCSLLRVEEALDKKNQEQTDRQT